MKILIDGSHAFARSFFGLSKLKTSEGLSSGGVYGFFQSLLSLRHKYDDASIYVCWDRGSWRRTAFAGYKKSRSPKEDSWKKQMWSVENVLTALCVPQFRIANLEADDIIAYFTLHDPQEGMVVYSGDTDLHQLVREVPYEVCVYNALKDEIWGNQKIHAHYGLEPAALPYVKALCGDVSDEIPGIRGVGEVTALKLIKTYGLWTEWNTETFTQMHKDKLRKGVADAIEEDFDKLARNFELVDLLYNHGPGDVDLTENMLPLQDELDITAVVDVFRRYELTRFLERLGEFTTLSKPSTFADVGIL